MFRAYKFLLKPSQEQEEILNRWVGCNRFIWNYFLEQNIAKYKQEKKFIFKMEMSKLLPSIKKKYTFLKEVPAHALLNRVFDLDNAISRVWKQGNGFPGFKSKDKDQHNTCRISQCNNHIQPTKKQIKLPKLGWIKWKRYRLIEGKLKNITIKKELGNWYIVCLCELKNIESKREIDSMIGLDVGLDAFAVTNYGKKVKTPKFYRKKQKVLRRKQRELARRRKQSKNRNKSKIKIGKLHRKIRNQRRDFTHQLSTEITNQYSFVVVEDLNIKGMIKNKYLAKSICDQGWRIFVDQLKYKTEAKGGKLIKIDRFAPSSKTCSRCRHKQEMPLNIRTYKCANCNLVLDRDHNAAINILCWGLDILVRMGHTKPAYNISYMQYACGDTSSGDQTIDWSSYVSKKQEKFLIDLGQEAASL